MTNLNDFLNIAIEQTRNLRQGEAFLIRDLFKEMNGVGFAVKRGSYLKHYF